MKNQQLKNKTMWLARDEIEDLFLHSNKPKKQNCYWSSDGIMLAIDYEDEHELLKGRTVSWTDKEPTPLHTETGLVEGVKKVIEELDVQIESLRTLHELEKQMMEVEAMINCTLQIEAYKYAKKVIQTFCKIE